MNTRASVSHPAISQSSVSLEGNHPRTLERDDVFHLLQNQRRRLVLRYLIEYDANGDEGRDATDTDSIEMRTVAEHVAAWENDTTVRGLTSTARQRVYIALYQSHLPKLDKVGVIEYDRNRGTIEPCTLLGQLEPYLLLDTDNSTSDSTEKTEETEETEAEFSDETESAGGQSRIEWSWNDYYLGLSVLSLLSVLIVTFQLLPGVRVGSWPWLSTIISGVVGISALIQRL